MEFKEEELELIKRYIKEGHNEYYDTYNNLMSALLSEEERNEIEVKMKDFKLGRIRGDNSGPEKELNYLLEEKLAEKGQLKEARNKLNRIYNKNTNIKEDFSSDEIMKQFWRLMNLRHSIDNSEFNQDQMELFTKFIHLLVLDNNCDKNIKKYRLQSNVSGAFQYGFNKGLYDLKIPNKGTALDAISQLMMMLCRLTSFIMDRDAIFKRLNKVALRNGFFYDKQYLNILLNVFDEADDNYFAEDMFGDMLKEFEEAGSVNNFLSIHPIDDGVRKCLSQLCTLLEDVDFIDPPSIELKKWAEEFNQ